MRLLCLTCEVLARPIYLCAARSPHVVDVELYRKGLHNTPTELRARLQARIDAVCYEEKYNAIVLGYGLCGQATAGLVACGVPLVIPARTTASPSTWGAGRVTRISSTTIPAPTGTPWTTSSAARASATR